VAWPPVTAKGGRAAARRPASGLRFSRRGAVDAVEQALVLLPGQRSLVATATTGKALVFASVGAVPMFEVEPHVSCPLTFFGEAGGKTARRRTLRMSGVSARVCWHTSSQ